MLHDDETLTAGEICKRADARRFLHSVLERPRQIAGRIFLPADHQSARIGSNYFQSLSLGERATDEKQFCLRTGNLRNLNFDLAATGAACLLKVNTPSGRHRCNYYCCCECVLRSRPCLLSGA